jgi:(E)-2-((N-methylformamido)methylene)succinate hydrolase
MGGLVAMGLAIAKPQRVKRLAVLNSVHEREPRGPRGGRSPRRIAIAPGLMSSRRSSRWFGQSNRPCASRWGHWLSNRSRQGYATAYRVFATG